jgi:hypothetical protein
MKTWLMEHFVLAYFIRLMAQTYLVTLLCAFVSILGQSNNDNNYLNFNAGNSTDTSASLKGNAAFTDNFSSLLAIILIVSIHKLILIVL